MLSLTKSIFPLARSTYSTNEGEEKTPNYPDVGKGRQGERNRDKYTLWEQLKQKTLA